MNLPESSADSKAAAYDAWYQTPRGRWIGETEFALIRSMLAADVESSLIDIACGIAALCFIEKEGLAVREMVRVAKRRIVIGLLNRHSLLWRRKGRNGGSGGYAGAKWHTPSEARRLFRDLPVRNVRVRSAVVFPGGGRWSRLIERLWPSWMHVGGFMCISGEIIDLPQN